LFAPDGTPQATVTFGQQFQNVSQGLFPDGNTNAVYFMTNFTPRASNTLGPSVPPQIQSISIDGGVVSLTFTITAGRNYRIDFKDDLSVADWAPLTGDLTADASTVTVHDVPGSRQQRFYRVVLLN